VTNPVIAPPPLPPAPWPALREALLAYAGERAEAGDLPGAARLRALVEGWWNAQCAWTAEAVSTLRLHHEVNNALVGVSGNAQLLMIGPAGRDAAVRARAETILRESRRIEEAVGRLRALRVAIDPAGGVGTNGARRAGG
jgi:signal transduction histidine kinase